jgi:hypothetical protein
MSDYPGPPPTQDPGPVDPGPEGSSRYQPNPSAGAYSSRYQPYPGAGPAYGGTPYQPYGTGGQPPGGPPAPPYGGGSGAFEDPFQRRLARRPEPRFATALAGAGAALALFGVLIWSGTYFGEGLVNSTDGDTDRNLLGAALGALLVVAGYILAVIVRRGPLATAGVVLAGVGVPLTVAFLTLDVTSSNGLNFDAVFWVSVIIWAVSYAVVPGTRGHTFFVFLIASGFFEYVLSKNTPHLSADIVTGTGPRFSGLGTIAAIGLAFGLGYFLIAFLLDRSGRHGPATGLIYPAFNATTGGVIAWSPDIHRLGAGVLAIVIGLLVSWYGGRYGRRITCFAAAAAVPLGIGLMIADRTNDGVKAGVLFLLIGIVVVVLAAVVGRALGEPHDMDPEAVVGSR